MADRPTNLNTRDNAGPGQRPELPPGTPRWVKVFGIAIVVLVLIFILMVASGHGPGRHFSGGGMSGQTPPTVTQSLAHVL